jgi:periplasmic protein TonB
VTQAAKTILLAKEDPALRRWIAAAAIVVAVHAGLILWLMRKHDVSVTGAAPAAVLIDLPPMQVSPPAETSPEVTEGPQQTKSEPEEVTPPQTMVSPELPPAQKPAAVLPSAPKPAPKPKKIVKENPKPVVKQTREPPAPRTTAPKRSEAARGQMSAAPQRSLAGSGASAASWHSQIFAHLLGYKPAGGEATGTVSISFTLARSGRLLAARLVGSSGSSALDSKALEMVRRANPFPAAPTEVSGGSFAFTVPVRFR